MCINMKDSSVIFFTGVLPVFLFFHFIVLCFRVNDILAENYLYLFILYIINKKLLFLYCSFLSPTLKIQQYCVNIEAQKFENHYGF